MSFKVRQKVGNHIYIYETVSYWDKEKKQPRQKRTFIGREDQLTGTVVDTKHPEKLRPVRTLDFGAEFFIGKLIEMLGIKSICKEVFPDIYEEIIALITYTLIHTEGYYLAEHWAEISFTSVNPGRIASQRISELFHKLGVGEDRRTDFFQKWIERNPDEDGFYFDISSLSSYSRLIPLVEWGYNRDDENLPQINFGVVYGKKSELPLHFQIYPGSITDTTTILNIKKYNAAYGLKNMLYMMDRGFYSKKNLGFLKDEQIIIPMPLSNNMALELIRKYNNKLSGNRNMFLHNDILYARAETRLKIDGKEYRAFLFRNRTSQEKWITLFFKKLLTIEKKMNTENITDEKELAAEVNEMHEGFMKYFTTHRTGRGLKLKRNETAIEEYCMKCGTFILLSSEKKYTGIEILDLYKQKDRIEKVFDVMKNDMDRNRPYVQSEERVRGKMLLIFISLIVSAYIEKILRQKKLKKQYTKNKLLAELKKVRLIEFGNGLNIVTEPTRKIKDIFDAFDIDYSKLLS